jgi:hypothetical protein
MEDNMDIVLLMRSASKLYWRKKDLCADCEKMGISCHDNLGSDLVDLRCKVNSKEIATALDIKQLRKIPPQSWCPKRRSNQLQD